MPFVTIQDGDTEYRASFATSRRREDSPSRSLGGRGEGRKEAERKSERDDLAFAEGRRYGDVVAAVVKILGDSCSEKPRSAADYFNRNALERYVNRPIHISRPVCI